jgi:hypothetical protein
MCSYGEGRVGGERERVGGWVGGGISGYCCKVTNLFTKHVPPSLPIHQFPAYSSPSPRFHPCSLLPTVLPLLLSSFLPFTCM